MQDERLFIKGQTGVLGEGSRVLLGFSKVTCRVQSHTRTRWIYKVDDDLR